MAPGRLSILPEVEGEDEGIMQREYARLMESREAAKKVQERWERGKENRIIAGDNPESSMDVDQGASSAVSSDYPATTRGVRRVVTEEVFN